MAIDATPIKWVASRKPEKYSSAAPLNADARYRIVAEQINLKSALTLALYVGPAPSTLTAKFGDDPVDRHPTLGDDLLTDPPAAEPDPGQDLLQPLPLRVRLAVAHSPSPP